MKIAVRRKHTFVDLKVDEMETIIFQSDSSEIDDTIENLQEVIEALTKLKQQEQ
jgi:HD superfamily phosphohydrolase YqeK